MQRHVVVIGGVLFVCIIGGTIGIVESPFLQYEEVSGDAGIEYNGTLSRTTTSGAGVYVADVTNNQRPDVLLIGGTPGPDGSRQPALYLNTADGFERTDLPLEDDFPEESINAAFFFDRNNNGWQDLLLLPVDDEPIFFKNLQGEFEVREVGLNETLSVPMGASAADYNGNGHLDLLIYQNGDWITSTPRGYQYPERRIKEDNGNPNLLFENTADGFKRVHDAGINGSRWSLATSFVDFSGNGFPDIHIANDYNTDYLYVNQGDGTFHEVQLGDATDRNGMSSEVADVTGNGRLDIFVTNIYFDVSEIDSEYTTNYLDNALGKGTDGNNLLINRGPAEYASADNNSNEREMFVDDASTYGVKKGGWGWATVIADLNNDGYYDIVHATQKFSETFIQSTYNSTDIPSYYQYPAVWMGTDTGFVQRDGAEAGFEPANGRGLSRLDYNRDGSLDIIATEWDDGGYKLYENNGPSGNWLQVDIAGNRSQTSIGARAYVTVNGTRQLRVRSSRTDYLSQNSRILHFGLGDSKTVDELRIVWPDGTERVYRKLDANQRIIVQINGDIKRDVTETKSS